MKIFRFISVLNLFRISIKNILFSRCPENYTEEEIAEFMKGGTFYVERGADCFVFSSRQRDGFREIVAKRLNSAECLILHKIERIELHYSEFASVYSSDVFNCQIVMEENSLLIDDFNLLVSDGLRFRGTFPAREIRNSIYVKITQNYFICVDI